jgi:hypothetical protein
MLCMVRTLLYMNKWIGVAVTYVDSRFTEKKKVTLMTVDK